MYDDGFEQARLMIDKSVISRLNVEPALEVVQPMMAAGLVAVSIVTEIEVGDSARSTTGGLGKTSSAAMPPLAIPYRAETGAREVQAALVE